MNCVIHNDAATFAHLTSYPIMRTYPTKWIEDSLEMLSFFPIMADDSLKNVLKRTKPSDWEQVGWRGYTFANGEYFWDEGYALSAINYESKQELAIREALIQKIFPQFIQASGHRSWFRLTVSMTPRAAPSIG